MKADELIELALERLRVVEAERRENNKRKGKLWREANPERHREVNNRWYEANNERIRELGWKHQGINLTWGRFVEMLGQQDYRCKVCSKTIDTSAIPDHNHITNAVRDVLCRNCNSAVSFLGESVGIVENLIEYLQTSEYHFDSLEDMKARQYHEFLYSDNKVIRRKEYKWNEQGIDIRYHEFVEILKIQDNRCAICCCGIDTSAQVDHNHLTGIVRGCLCHLCNKSIGLIYDSISIAESLLEYLKKYEC